MPILPVLDLMGGVVVRGVAGRRAEYRPIVSAIAPSPEPTAVARAFRERFGFTELYVADLDAIAGQPPAMDLYRRLQDDGFRLWVDAGIRDDAKPLLDAGVDSIVAGLETVAGPAALEALGQQVGPDRLVFSLDLKAGQPLGRPGAWPADAWAIAQTALARGVTRLLVLDLARVGVGEGVGTEELCARLWKEAPHLQLTAGGGIRGPDDVQRLYDHGVDYVLVASALHDGRLAVPNHGTQDAGGK